MTQELVTAHPGDSVSECMHVMTDKRVRHLPVIGRRQNGRSCLDWRLGKENHFGANGYDR